MSRVVVFGAGIAGHTAASYLRTWLDKTDDVVVVSPQSNYNWVPSNIWLGLGLMTEEIVTRRNEQMPNRDCAHTVRRLPT
jgi:sulfide:quinone oxidoreductase